MVGPIFGNPPLPRFPGVLDAGGPKATVGDHASDVRVIVVELAEGLHHHAVDELELAHVGRDVNVGKAADQAVIKLSGPTEEPRLLALLADAEHDFMPRLPLLDELRD